MAMAAALLGSASPPSWSSSMFVALRGPGSGIARPVVAFSNHPSPSSSTSCSPFTERNSLERYQRDSWLYLGGGGGPLPPVSQPHSGEQNACVGSDRENDIALQLPELRSLLEILRERRGAGAGGPGVGSVSLVGTGPGDPELLTLKAVRAIEGADLILYDRLVSHDVLHLVRPDARLLYVGKTAGYHSRTQEEIHELLLNFAEAGANVVRLKGGDPLLDSKVGMGAAMVRRTTPSCLSLGCRRSCFRLPLFPVYWVPLRNVTQRGSLGRSRGRSFRLLFHLHLRCRRTCESRWNKSRMRTWVRRVLREIMDASPKAKLKTF